MNTVPRHRIAYRSFVRESLQKWPKTSTKAVGCFWYVETLSCWNFGAVSLCFCVPNSVYGAIVNCQSKMPKNSCQGL